MAAQEATTSSPTKANPLDGQDLFNDPEFKKLSIPERNKIYLDRVHASAKSSNSTIILMNKPDCEITTPQGDNCTLPEYGSQVSCGDGVFWIPKGSTLTIHSPTACNLALDPAEDQTIQQNPDLTVQNAKPAAVFDTHEGHVCENDIPKDEGTKEATDASENNTANTTARHGLTPLYIAPTPSNVLDPVTGFELTVGKDRPSVYFDDFMAINGRFFPDHKVLLNKHINLFLIRPVVADGVTILVHAQVLAMYFPALSNKDSEPYLHIARHFDGFTTAALLLAFYHVDRQDITMEHIVSSDKLQKLFTLWVHWNPQLEEELIQFVWDALNNWVCRL